MFLSKIIIFLQTLNQNSPAAVNTNGNTKGQNAKDEEAWINLTTGEPRFPVSELARLEEMIGRTRWVVPILPKCELEILLDASINLCKRGLDTRSEACQRFFQEGLTKSFTKILTTDGRDGVSSWKFEIHRCIMRNCEKLVELCVSKLSQDCFPLLELLAKLPEVSRQFFNDQILQLGPGLMTESGLKCFNRFFEALDKKKVYNRCCIGLFVPSYFIWQ